MQQTPGETPDERAEHWTKIIEEARKYPGGVLAFLRDKKVPKDNYYSWFKKLRHKHPEWTDLPNPKKGKKKLKSQGRALIQTEVSAETASRRTFNRGYKEKILRETDLASTGQISAILRREGLYSSHLQNWREERELRNLTPSKRGPKVKPETNELKRLKSENERLHKRLDQANKIIVFQKKVASLLGETMPEFNDQD